jgi:hypothetical protein
MYEMFSRSNLIQIFIPTKGFAQNFVKAVSGVGVAIFRDQWGEAAGSRQQAAGVHFTNKKSR